MIRATPLALVLVASSVFADRVDQTIKAEMLKDRIPGVALAVMKDGKAVKVQGYGVANVEWNVPVTKDTIFEIGSITKQFTATLILRLVEDNKLKLDDKVRQHLANAPASWNAITLRQLLNHTSGITNYNSLPGFEVRKKLKADTFLKEIAPYPLMFAPGDAWSYCNSAYNTLGYVIERATGQTYWQVLKTEIFDRCGMIASQSRDQNVVVTNRASGYEIEKGRLVNRDSDLTDVFSAGAIVSTVADLMKWDPAKLLSQSSYEEMCKPVRLNNGRTLAYGLGLRFEDYKGHKNIGHGGSTSGFSASYQRFPNDKLVVIVLCNLGKHGVATDLARAVADLYFTKN
ncbi:MAG TPA: serine hydrolase domain-containing protein [Verrucomicrobiae bacterium]|nr:serine hydrolase domain-containing protein [Verrucomicrobiae bacterium]